MVRGWGSDVQQNVQQNVQQRRCVMPDFLTRRHGTWHFVRRVPTEFAQFDRRGIVKHSTRVRIAEDRNGRRASRVADRLNQELEAQWRAQSGGNCNDHAAGYEQARLRARALGFDYLENGEVLQLPTEQRLARLEALVTKGVANDPGARAALLGTEKRPLLMLSKLQAEHEALVGDQIKDMSPEQLRIWRTSRIRSVKQFVDVVRDKAVTEITENDGLDYVEWWRSRVVSGETNSKTANRDIGQLSRMLKDVRIRKRYKFPDIFKDLHLRGETEKSRVPFDNEFIQSRLLGGALNGLNEDARFVLYVMIETGMRPSEIVNLQAHTIHLDAPIPYVEILPDGRQLKTEDSRREIPLVGVALEALKLRPHGFAKYRDKSSGMSGTLNKYLKENGLRPTVEHTVYSLRHSFKDRLAAAEAPDSLIDNLMGHRTGKPRYGKGPSLVLKLKFLAAIAFTSPKRL
jgi:integrase